MMHEVVLDGFMCQSSRPSLAPLPPLSRYPNLPFLFVELPVSCTLSLLVFERAVMLRTQCGAKRKKERRGEPPKRSHGRSPPLRLLFRCLPPEKNGVAFSLSLVKAGFSHVSFLLPENTRARVCACLCPCVWCGVYVDVTVMCALANLIRRRA